MEIPKPERIILEEINKPFEELIQEKRDILFPKLLEIIRYCEKNKTDGVPFLEIETGEEILIFNVEKPYDLQINNTLEYYEEMEEYEICKELKSYLD